MIEKVESHTQIILKSLNKWIKYQKLFSFNIFAYIDTTGSSSFLYIYFLFIYLAAPGLSCGMWDLVPWPGIEPGLPALGARSLSHWTAREVPDISLKSVKCIIVHPRSLVFLPYHLFLEVTWCVEFLPFWILSVVSPFNMFLHQWTSSKLVISLRCSNSGANLGEHFTSKLCVSFCL